MSRILVAGGLDDKDKQSKIGEARVGFARAIGREIVLRGHLLLGGCATGLDAIVAEAGAEAAKAHNLDPRKYIKSWVTETTNPTHNVGEILHSRMGDWKNVPRRLIYPEPFQEADVVIIIGGWEGTQYAASWARLANKPIVPVAALGLAATEIFEDEIVSFDRRYSNRISLDEYQRLNRLLFNYEPTVIEAFAKEVTALTEWIVKPLEAFIIMSFAQRGELAGC